VTASCAAGKYQTQAPSALQDRVCSTCATGVYCAGGAAAPAPCQAGTTWDHDANPATACAAVTASCAAGKYQTQAPTALEDRICTACTAGQYCAGGVTAPAACQVGSTWDHDANPATACAAVTASCAAGKYQTQTPTALQDRICTACTAGQYCAGGVTAPAACQVGSTWDHDGNPATACVAVAAPCAAGKRETQAPSAVQNRLCTACVAGEYCAGGAAAPVACTGTVWDDDSNPATACHARKDCALDEHEVSAGNSVTDRSCAACPVDYAAFEVNAPSCLLWTGGPSFTHVATVDQSSCATRADNGQVVCWGHNVGTRPTAAAFKAIDGGYFHYCGILTSGATQCWGSDTSGESTGVPAVSFKAVSAGGNASCGIRTDNSRVQCWPSGLVPPALSTVTFSSISGGQNAWCGIRSDTSEAVCWGNSSYVVNNVPSGVAFKQVSTGLDDACGIRAADDQVQCWGYSGNVTYLNPMPALAFGSVSVSEQAVCGLRADNGEAVCWGLMADNAKFHTPRGVAFTELSMSTNQNSGIGDGGRHNQACGVRAFDGKVQCWGFNGSGKVEGNQDSNIYSEVVAGSVSACGLRADGTLTCWHRDGGAIMSTVPTNTTFIGLGHQGYDESCAIRADNGLLECWGNNPTVAPRNVAFESISINTNAGGCGVRASDGTLQCWGAPGSAHLTGVPTGIPFKAVGIGVNFACALRADDDTVTCWGSNYMGDVALAPAGVAFDSLSVGVYQACGIRTSDGHVQCWGDLGALAPLPTTAFSSVSVGANGACGIRASNSQLQCWGSSPPAKPIVGFAPTGIAFDRVSVYNDMACGVLSASGRLVCWGEFTYNPLFQTP
jgi:hypothetical protein